MDSSLKTQFKMNGSLKTFSFTSTRVITGSFDKSAKIWDPSTGECLATLWGHTGEVVAAQFNGKADLAVTGSMDHTAKLYDTGTGEIEKSTNIRGIVINYWPYQLLPSSSLV